MQKLNVSWMVHAVSGNRSNGCGVHSGCSSFYVDYDVEIFLSCYPHYVSVRFVSCTLPCMNIFLCSPILCQNTSTRTWY